MHLACACRPKDVTVLRWDPALEELVPLSDADEEATASSMKKEYSIAAIIVLADQQPPQTSSRTRSRADDWHHLLERLG
eukprot:15096-Amphidinium_carterae.2